MQLLARNVKPYFVVIVLLNGSKKVKTAQMGATSLLNARCLVLLD